MRRYKRLFVQLVLVLCTWRLPAGSATAAPFVPADDALVLALLPAAQGDKRLQAERQALQRHPDDATLARTLVQNYLDQARAVGDPRYLGYAEAALAHWRNEPHPPVDIQLMRAVILQARHEFHLALQDLDDILKRDPFNHQALITRASVHQVHGDYDAARSDCHTLQRNGGGLYAEGCLALLSSLTGQADFAYQFLELRQAETAAKTPQQKQWIQGLLAEISERRGDRDGAERHYRAALAQGIDNYFLLNAYATFLLDENRPADMLTLLQGRPRMELLLLNLTEAADRLQRPERKDYVETLQALFEAGRLRGGMRHLREEARFQLDILHHPSYALQLAQQNWEQQREPADARLLLETAQAAGKPQATRELQHWLTQTGLHDARITAVLDRQRIALP